MDGKCGMAKQVVNMQKITVIGMIDNMIMLWDQTGKIVKPILDQAVWVPEESKKVLREWLDNTMKGCESIKNAVNTGYGNLEKFISPEKPEPSRQPPKYPFSYADSAR